MLPTDTPIYNQVISHVDKGWFSGYRFVLGLVFGILGGVFLVVGVVNFIVSLLLSVKATFILGITFGILGLAFLLVTFFMINKGNYYRRLKATLAQYGKRLPGQIVELQSTSVRINNNYLYRVVARWIDYDTNTAHLFRGDSVKGNNLALINTPIEIWVDQNNFELYYVNLDKITYS